MIKRTTLFLFALLSVCSAALAQTARVQIVHNSPSPTVDIYVNGTLALDNFQFRTATPFLSLPAGVPLDVAVAPENSTSAADAIANFPVTFADGGTYIVTAIGIVGNAATPFTLQVNDAAREAAANPLQVDVAVLHGSPGAPAVDVDARFVAANVVSDLAYGENTGYLSLPNAKFDLAVRAAGDANVVASYRADLSNLQGAAAYVFASGVLGGSPAFGLFAALPSGAVVELPLTPTARLQVIHNAPDPTVDVYAGTSLLLNDFAFRTATPFIDVPADIDITLGVAPAASTSSADAIALFPVNFETGKTYVVTANGLVGGNPPFTLVANANGRETSASAGTVDVAIFHGSPNAPSVDVDAVFVANDVVSNLSYGEFTPYLSLPAGKYDFRVRVHASQTAVGTYRADLSGLGGQAAYVFASGIVGATPAFGVFAALPNGTVVELPLTQTARVQIIHNAPNPTVDVYAGTQLLIDDFVFRSATPFIDVPADIQIPLGVAPPTSTSSSQALATFPATFEAGKTYIVTASGLVTGNPAFGLIVNDAAREAAANANLVDVAVLHGSPNAPAVDVDAVFVADNLVSNLAYGEFTPYLSLPAAKYDLAVRAAGDPNVVASFRADLSGLAGSAAYVFASGLLGGNPAFGLYAALPNGAVVQLPLTPTARVQVIHNSIDGTVDVYAGTTRLLDDFQYRTATPFIDVPADIDIVLGVAPAGSANAGESFFNTNVNLPTGSVNTVFADGSATLPSAPFTLIVDGTAQETASGAGVAVSAYHGSPNAPIVDVHERLAGLLFGDLAYSLFTPYAELPAANYYLDIKAAGTDPIVATFQADLSALGGQAVRVFASGFLGGSPAFGLFAVLANGTVVELPAVQVARVQVLHNSPSPTVDVYVNGGLAIDDFEFRTATPFLYLPAGAQLNIGVAPASSTSAADTLVNFTAQLENGKTYLVVASGIVGDANTPFKLFINDAVRESALNDDNVELAVLHGSPGAPAVGVTPVGSTTAIIPTLAYGEFTPYLSLPPAEYNLDVHPAGQSTQLVGTWGADLTTVPGLVGVVFASGIVGSTNPDEAFGLWIVFPDGGTGPLQAYARAQVIHNSPSPTVDVYFDEDLGLDDFAFRTATPIVLLPAATPFTVSVAPGTSTSVDDAVYSLDIAGLQTGRTYLIMAAGVVGNAATPFQLYINDAGRFRSATATNADVVAFHGAPDAPTVDVKLAGGPVVIDDLAFGTYSNYLSVPAGNLTIDVTPFNDNNAVVGRYIAPLSQIPGQSVVVFASGYLAGNPDFGLWATLADGTTFPLEQIVGTNQANELLAALQLSPNPAVSDLRVDMTLKETESLRYAVRDVTGRLALEGDFGTVPAGDFMQLLQVGTLNPGMYSLEVRSTEGVSVRKFVVQRN